jgi:ribonuclease BN (tRNA processing enzyme)
VPDTSTLFGLSRRSLLTGLLATPTLAATVEPSAAQSDRPRWTTQQAQAVLTAKGADVLVHETMYVPAVETYIRGQIAEGRPVKFDAFMAHMKADHTPSEDVGRIAQEAGVKTLVLSHLTPAMTASTDKTWRAPVAKYFKGEIIVGKDLMVV